MSGLRTIRRVGSFRSGKKGKRMARLSCTTCRLVRRLAIACGMAGLATLSATDALPAGPLDHAAWLLAMGLAVALVALNLIDRARRAGAALRRLRGKVTTGPE